MERLKNNHGGPGRGQGRHPKPNGPMPNRTIRMTDEEYPLTKEFLELYRKYPDDIKEFFTQLRASK